MEKNSKLDSSETRPVMPLVSIGVPVYNGAATLERVLDSLLRQSLVDFELIISDNNSNDGTAAICQAFADRDVRVRYIRQVQNLGAVFNFQYVMDQARGRYFLWAACDDVRTLDFLEENVRFLENNPDYVASASPNCFEGEPPVGANFISFSIAAPTIHDRFHLFFQNCWESHGIFYSVVRTEVLKKCELFGQSFAAADWAFNLFLASQGNIHRCDKGLTIFGLNGVSSRSGSYRAFRTRRIELLLPFYRLSLYVLKLSAQFPLREKFKILRALFKINMRASWGQAYSALYQLYCAHLKPKRKLTHLE
ncbi:glycosyltransferase family 2 protein [Herminiimonas sp. NPDC097707]|uniref:glycosyltransferase family 2 protein n=1 Tax=Herminiimonas sp. NPDC097707 TaxID=3364007 RepID=UPI00383A29F2